MATNLSDLNPWQETLRKLSSTEFNLGPDDPLLYRIERQADNEAERRARNWLRGAWAAVLGLAIGGRLYGMSLQEMQEALRRIERRPLEVADLARAAGQASVLGERKAHVEIGHAPPSGPQGPPGDHALRLNAQWLARVSAADKMREWAEGMKADVRWQVVQAIREGASVDELRERLEARWDDYGQNFAMIAQTELAIAYNGGYMLALPEHSYVTVPAIGDAKVCQKCKHLLEGKVFEVLHHAPKHPVKLDWETKLWPGKPGRKPGSREDVPAVPLHPRCRHRVVFYSGRGGKRP